MKTLTLVVTYNEADNIARLVPAILRNVPQSHVLVVDDNSPDGTRKSFVNMPSTTRV
jgi:Glycosyltransferases involved in cell wall biogenesis